MTLPAVHRSRAVGTLSSLIEEDVADDIERSLVFASRALDLLDAASSVQHVTVAAAITGARHLGWRTRAEQQASPNSMATDISAPERATAEPDQVYRKTDLPSQAREIALDLTALLGRAFRGR